MFKENKLIYYQNVPDSIKENFDNARSKKISTRQAVDGFHKNKNAANNDIEQDEFDQNETENEDTSAKEDVIDLTILLKKQLNTSLNQKERFIDYENAEKLLQELKQKRNPRQLAEVRSQISARQRNVSGLIQQIDQNGILKINGQAVSIFREATFGGVGEKEAMYNDFIKLTPAEQERKLEEIKNYLQKSIQQFNKLLSLVNGPGLETEIVTFKKLDNQNRLKYLKNATDVQADYFKLIDSGKLSEKQITDQKKLFAEKGIEGKKLLLKHLQEALSPEADTKLIEFEQALPSRRAKFPEFNLLSPSEKETILRQIREEIKKEYLDQFRNHKYFFAAGPKDIELFESTFKKQNGRFNIQEAEACLKWLDSTMEGLLKIKQEEEKYPRDILNHFKWDELKDYEKQELLKKGGKIEKYAENQENITLDKDYKKKLNSYLAFQPLGLINQEGLKSYYEWFQSLSTDKKSKIVSEAEKNPKLDYLEETKNQRIRTNADFLKFPKTIQREYKDAFLESGFEERKILILKVKDLVALTEKEMEAKLDEVIEKKLLAPTSRARYLRGFKRCNISQRQEYLADCNLDKEHRQEVLDEFENEVINLIPEDKRKQVENKFYNLDLKNREKYLKALRKQYKPKTKKEEEVFEAKTKAKKETKKIEDVGIMTTKLSVVHKHFIKSAEKYEKSGDKESALKFYQEALEVEIEMPTTDKLRIEAKIMELKKEQEHYQKIQEGQFQEIILTEIDQLISSNELLTKEQMHLTMLEEAYQLQVTNERYYEQATDGQTRMNNSLEDQYTIEANQAFMDYTGDQSLYLDQYDDLEIGEALNFDIAEYGTTENLPFWTDYFSNIQDLPKEARSDARFQFINGKTGEIFSSKKFKQEYLDPQRETFVTDQIAPALFEKLDISDNKSLQAEVLKVVKKKDYKRRLPKTEKDNLAA